MAQLIEALLCNPEGVSSNPQNPNKKPGVAYICKPRALGRWREEDCWGSFLSMVRNYTKGIRQRLVEGDT